MAPLPLHLYLDPTAGPLLPQAIAAAGAKGAMADALWVFPGSRALRRCKELLALSGAHLAPRMTTLGALPEWLRTDPLPLASDLVVSLARAVGARQVGAALEPAFPKPPETDDWAGWLALSRQIGRLANDLGEAGLTFDTVEASDTQAVRWQALAKVEAAALAQLAAWGVGEKNAARRAHGAALAADPTASPAANPNLPFGRIVLVACLDVSRPAQAALEGFLAGGGQVLVLSPALQKRQTRTWFDAWGRPVPASWQDENCLVKLPQEPVFVPDFGAQAGQVTASVRHCLSQTPALSPDDFSVGVADETQAPLLKIMLENAGLPVRHGPGRPAADSPPAAALRALGAFLRQRDPDDATRKPEALCEALNNPTLARCALTVVGDAAALVALQSAIKALPIEKIETKELWRQCDAALLALGAGEAHLSAWGSHWRRLLAGWFPPPAAPVAAFGPARDLEKALALLDAALATLEAAPVALEPIGAAVSIDVVLDALTGQTIPEEGGNAAVELIGPLEWLLDDAPHLILTGLNGEYLPAPPKPHPFLPDSLRRKLGLSCDATRLARDLASFEAILNSRQTVLLAAQHSLDGAALTPSRLLLRCDDDTLAARFRRFFLPAEQAATGAPVAAEGADAFLPIAVPAKAPGLTQLSVSGFKAYLACPYRFWLTHALKLRQGAEVSREFSPQDFGSYLHKVLAAFGNSTLKDSDDPRAIERFLLTELAAHFDRDFGDAPRVALRLQKAMLQARLKAFAKTQAQLAPDWEIEAVELDQQNTTWVEGFTLRGRIDRLDRHRHTGQLRILDYKTSDSAKEPHSQHLKGEAWIDLQLPLYTVLCAAPDAQVGYFNLDQEDARIALWSEKAKGSMGEGVEKARAIAQIILAGGRAAFWPPKDPPAFDDGLQALCMDHAPDRAARFARAMGGQP